MKVTVSVGSLAKRKRGVQGKIARKRLKDNKFAETLKANALRTITETSDVRLSTHVNFSNVPKQLSHLNFKVNDNAKNLTTNCVPVTKGVIPKHFPKKDKKKLRHDAFLKRLQVANGEKANNKKKKKRGKKTKDVIMEEAPTLAMNAESTLAMDAESKASEEELPEKERKIPVVKLKQSILKKKDRLNQERQDIQLFKEVMSNSVYKANPGAAITSYVRQKICESLSES